MSTCVLACKQRGRLCASLSLLGSVCLQDATGNAADIAAAWAIGCGAPFAFGACLLLITSNVWPYLFSPGCLLTVWHCFVPLLCHSDDHWHLQGPRWRANTGVTFTESAVYCWGLSTALWRASSGDMCARDRGTALPHASLSPIIGRSCQLEIEPFYVKFGLELLQCCPAIGWRAASVKGNP